MQTIGDIRFDSNTYIAASYWTLLLHQQDGIAVVIPVPDADLMSFVHVFDDRIKCQNHINANLQKMITLFAYDGKYPGRCLRWSRRSKTIMYTVVLYSLRS